MADQETNEEDDFFAPQSEDEKRLFESEKPPKEIVAKPKESTAEVKPEPSAPKPQEKPAEPEKPAEAAPNDKEASTAVPAAPQKAPNEPDWRFNLRKKIFDGAKSVREAKTVEEKTEAQKEVTEARRELAKQSRKPSAAPLPTEDQAVLDSYKDPKVKDTATKTVSAFGKAAGFVTDEGVRESVKDVLREEREIASRNATIDEFFKANKDVYADEENREIFFNTVENYFNYAGKGHDELMFIFDSAHKQLFPDDLESTLAKADALKEKIAPTAFNGGNAAPAAKPKDAEKQALIDQYKARGEDVSWLLED